MLQKVYQTIYITKVVEKEFGKPIPDWIKIIEIKDIRYQSLIEFQLDKGESSVIALATELEEVLLILDDLKARKYAKKLQLRFTGTLGVINRAKELDVINKVKPILLELQKTDFRVADNIIKELLDRNDE